MKLEVEKVYQVLADDRKTLLRFVPKQILREKNAVAVQIVSPFKNNTVFDLDKIAECPSLQEVTA